MLGYLTLVEKENGGVDEEAPLTPVKIRWSEGPAPVTRNNLLNIYNYYKLFTAWLFDVHMYSIIW